MSLRASPSLPPHFPPHYSLGNGGDVQDWSLQCPSNAIWPFKIYLSQNNPSKCNPKLKMETSPEVFNTICTPQELTSLRHCHLQEMELDGWFLLLHIVLETCTMLFMHKFNMSFVIHFCILGFEATLQLKGWNLIALQNETHMRAPILNTKWRRYTNYRHIPPHLCRH